MWNACVCVCVCCLPASLDLSPLTSLDLSLGLSIDLFPIPSSPPARFLSIGFVVGYLWKERFADPQCHQVGCRREGGVDDAQPLRGAECLGRCAVQAKHQLVQRFKGACNGACNHIPLLDTTIGSVSSENQMKIK